jgi:hypothetical protein
MLADGTPDLSGVWLGSGSYDSDISRGLKAGSSLVMLPWAEKLVGTRQSKDDPRSQLPSRRNSPRLAVSVAVRANSRHLLHPV